MRHSEHLILDLEQLNEILHSSNCYLGKDGRLSKISKKLNSLSSLIHEAIIYEKAKGLNPEKGELKEQITYAKHAIHSYKQSIEKKKVELPLEYVNMKKKLHNMSSLNKIGYSNSGGKLR